MSLLIATLPEFLGSLGGALVVTGTGWIVQHTRARFRRRRTYREHAPHQ